LATIDFVGIAPGSSGLTVSNVIAIDSVGTDIFLEIAGATVAVVPEPDTFLLLAGAAAFGVL
jgi:hypothetical protein